MDMYFSFARTHYTKKKKKLHTEVLLFKHFFLRKGKNQNKVKRGNAFFSSKP